MPRKNRRWLYLSFSVLAVIVFLRSGSDSTITVENKKGKGLSNEQITYLRDALRVNSNKVKKDEGQENYKTIIDLVFTQLKTKGIPDRRS